MLPENGTERTGTAWPRPSAERPCGSVQEAPTAPWTASDQLGVTGLDDRSGRLLRKEVIQPHLPVRLPCYDFTPIADPTFDGSLLAVGPPASGVTNFRGVTGGVYKARERIHPGVADPGLLATPTSRSRVADFDPNLDRLFEIRSPSRDSSSLYRPL